jgi:hypothetical protein
MYRKDRDRTGPYAHMVRYPRLITTKKRKKETLNHNKSK